MEFTVLGAEPCGCKVVKHPDKNMNPFIQYCPSHKATSDLYEACLEVDKSPQPTSRAKAMVKLALAKVEEGRD